MSSILLCLIELNARASLRILYIDAAEFVCNDHITGEEGTASLMV